MSLEPLSTASGSDFPLCRQLSVFLENRLGQLLRLTRMFENTDMKILALTVVGANECAIVRLIVNDPDRGRDLLTGSNFACTETEVLVVELPRGKRGIRSVCETLIAAEVNMHYTYPLLPVDGFGACMAVHADDLPQGAAALTAREFRLIDQSEL